MDDAGFARIRSKGDQALFGGFTTKEMKERLGVKDSRPLADFLPTLTIVVKNLATEMTNYNVEEKDLQGEMAITTEHLTYSDGEPRYTEFLDGKKVVEYIEKRFVDEYC